MRGEAKVARLTCSVTQGLVAHSMKSQAASLLSERSGTARPQDHMVVPGPSEEHAGRALKPVLSVTMDCFGSTKIEANRLASGPKVAALPCANCVVASYQSKEVTPGAESFISPAHSSKPFLILSLVKRGFQSLSK